MAKNPSLSVVLATHNEADNLTRCLNSVKKIADEIVVVDGNSDDKTVEIARSFGAKVIKTSNKPNFHINKRAAIEAATGKWVLFLDADEEVSKELAIEIKSLVGREEEIKSYKVEDEKKKKLFNRHLDLLQQRDGGFEQTGPIRAFFIARKNMFLGRALMHGGVYPDGVIRLFENGFAQYPAKDVHEQIVVEGRVGWLNHELLHNDSPTFEKYLKRANRYTNLTATKFAEEKISINLWTMVKYCVIKPKMVFLSLYFRHKGFLDGFPGFVFCLFSALHYPMAYFKHYQAARS